MTPRRPHPRNDPRGAAVYLAGTGRGLNTAFTLSLQDRGDRVVGLGAGDWMMATLVAFPAFGFFAATLLTLARFLALVLCASTAVTIIGIAQGMPLLHGIGLGFGDLALSQVGYGLGLVWVASTRSPITKD